jgi:polar amino acid transport system permease protein
VIPISSYLEVLPILLEGLNITVIVLIGSAILGYTIAFVAGFGRISKNVFISKFTVVYVEFFRGTSLIVQMFWFYYAFQWSSAIWPAVLAIGLNYGAYTSEVVRSSILAVSEGQYEAATALNMSRFQRMRLVILPQAVRMMLPEFGNYLVQMLKATSIAALVGLAEITHHGMILRASNFSLAVEVFTMLLVMYFLLALPLIALTKWLERLSSKGVASE